MKQRRRNQTYLSHPPPSWIVKCSHQSLYPQLSVTQATIHVYTYQSTVTYTHTCIQTYTCIYMSVCPATQTLPPSHMHRCRHLREGTFQGILTCYNQVLLTLPIVSRNQIFIHGHFYLFLDVRGASCHHNQLFTCKLRPGMDREQGREEALRKSALQRARTQENIS